jgi:imidazolonepropionase-like amidohydrolase
MVRGIPNSVCILMLAAATAALAQAPVAITGGKLLTITHGTIENGTVVLSGGKITAVGPAASVKVPAGAQIVDAKGMTVYPGLIDSETNLGLVEVEADAMSRDLAEPSDEIMPHMHVADAFHAETARIPVTRYNGITNAIVAPGPEDTFAGEDIFIQLAGRTREDMILKRDCALAMHFSEEQKRPRKFPSTRMGLISEMRQALLDAQDYQRHQEDYTRKLAEWEKGDKKKDAPEAKKRDLKLEALLPYLRGEKPVVLDASEGHDVETAMRLANEFHLKVVLEGVTRSQEILDEIAAYKVPVIFGSIYENPTADQRYDAVYSMPAELARRGVKVAFATYGVEFNRNLPYTAGFAVAYGMPYDEALKAITLNPAEIWGMSDTLGSLDVGKTANVVIANGDPLDVRTSVKQVYIAGQAIPMETRQTKLRDEYTR